MNIKAGPEPVFMLPKWELYVKFRIYIQEKGVSDVVPTAKNIKTKDPLRFEIAGLILMALALLTLISVINPAVGIMGSFINGLLMRLAGEGRFFVPAFLAVLGIKMMLVKHKSKTTVSVTGVLMIVIVMLTLLHLSIPGDYILQSALAGDGGGLIGGLVFFILLNSFGLLGLYIVLMTLFLVGLLLVTNQSMAVLLVKIKNWLLNLVKKTIHTVDEFLFTSQEHPDPEPASEQPLIINEYTIETTEKSLQEEETTAACATRNMESTGEKKSNVIYYRPQHQGGAKKPLVAENSQGQGLQDPEGRGNVAAAREHSHYKLPPTSLLAQPERHKTHKHGRDITASVDKLEDTLASFGIKCKVTQVTRGPAITRYEIQPPLGVKVSRIVNLADDIALNMASSGVRIEAPIPGKAVVGIEVPNQEIATVYLRELVETVTFQRMPSYLTFALGKDIAGQPVVDDLSRMPHLLIAGATGAGKSVCLNTILGSILYKATPKYVKMLIIDPKMVELSIFNDIPHLVSPVVTDPKKAATSLRWAVKEMEYRYGLFARHGVRDIARYNSLMQDRNEMPLPLLVIVIDELADLMMVAPADVEDAICRLAQMARAAGMHLVIATQRPSVDIITGLIKANIPSRISFAVSSQIDSRTILDMGGAEKLLGRGDMLYYPVGAAKPIRVLGAYLSDREVEQLVQHWVKQSPPEYDQQWDNKLTLEAQVSGNEDEILPRAVKMCVETGHASISLLQRRLHIGYARAARLMDLMEKKGYVGGYEGSKPRAVLITDEEYQNYFGEQTVQCHAGGDK